MHPGGALIYVDATLDRASPNASYGPAFLFPEDASRSSYRPPLTDYGNGLYTTNYVPLVSGAYTVRATLVQPGGLDATYFEQGSFTRPMETRHDRQLAFDWGDYQYNAPDPGQPDLVSRGTRRIRWREVVAPQKNTKRLGWMDGWMDGWIQFHEEH